MLVSRTHKFVYIDPPKTASTSLDKIFKKLYNAEVIRPINSSNTKHGRNIPNFAKDYYKVISVRHPASRIISYYLDYCNKSVLPKFSCFGDFIDHCIEVSSRPNTFDDKIYRYYPLYKYVEPLGFDYYIKVETLQKDFNNMPFVDSPVTIPTTNKNLSKEHIDIYPYLDKINTWAGLDYCTFNYGRILPQKQTSKPERME